jgi:hypothetical protein
MSNRLNKLIGISGLILGAAALAVGSIFPSRIGLTAGLAVAGVLALIWFFFSEFDAFKSLSRKRASHLRLNSLLTVVFFIFIVVLLNLTLL